MVAWEEKFSCSCLGEFVGKYICMRMYKGEKKAFLDWDLKKMLLQMSLCFCCCCCCWFCSCALRYSITESIDLCNGHRWIERVVFNAKVGIHNCNYLHVRTVKLCKFLTY